MRNMINKVKDQTGFFVRLNGHGDCEVRFTDKAKLFKYINEYDCKKYLYYPTVVYHRFAAFESGEPVLKSETIGYVQDGRFEWKGAK